MGDFIGSGSVQNNTSGLEMCNVWAVFSCSDELSSGEVNEGYGRGEGGSWEIAGLWPKLCLPSFKVGLLENV